ncbi:hypothetical protein GA0070624_4967 [Micromonospora rhizosphaerae]|uniref:N-acetyltransferase domain-containing protein n=1 Tax=Micromonospora rhizosphaerae TaxID=568872 RepID=A0A1C6SXR7_9ACTN|nr:hypothetical protein [Micromonospora rhizosphaerae]SCL34351.1 hypothetical protein GA0070624_4967 [Micromonospora rhizosphaerae]
MTGILPTVRARWCDIGEIASLVADSLPAAAIGAWLVPDEDQRRSLLTAVSRIWIEHALLVGDVFLLADRSAAAVWFHRYRPFPPPASYRQRLAAACGDHLDRFRCLDRVLKAHRPTDTHNHLAFLAVPAAAGRVARASVLLASCLVRMDRLVLPAYAEATTLAEAALYGRHGYVARDPFALPNGTMVHPLWRPAGDRAAPAVRLSKGRPGW